MRLNLGISSATQIVFTPSGNPIYVLYEDFDAHCKDFSMHITDAERARWNGMAAGDHNHDAAYAPLSHATDVVKHITATATNNYWDIKTGADGTALLEGLEVGTTYIVEELEPPAGYLNSGYRKEIVLKESRTHTLTVANSKRPALEIIKKDKVTGAFLEGATFRVSWNNGADYRDVTTGKDGKAKLTDLKDGVFVDLFV